MPISRRPISAPAGATIGSVVKAGSGDKTYSYTISARDGTACPVQLPLSTTTAVTVALVRQDEGSCTNDNVADTGSAVVAGSATVSPETSATSIGRYTPCWGVPQHELSRRFEMLPPARNDSNRCAGQRRKNFRVSDRRGWSGHRIRTFAGWGTAGHQAAEPRY